MSEFKSMGKIPRLNRDVVITEKIDGTNASVVIEPALTAEGDPDALYTTAIDGVVHSVRAGARNNYRQPGKQDNYGWAGFVQANAEELVRLLGVGRHFGEWWGAGIQRRYGLTDKRFSLFNVSRYGAAEEYTDPRCKQDWAKLEATGMAWELFPGGPATAIKHALHKGVKVCACRETQLAVNVVIGGVLIKPVPVLYRGPWFVPNGVVWGGGYAPTMALDALSFAGSSAAPGFMQPEGIVVFHEASGQLFKATLEGDEKPKGVA